jgi:hypothetical protein
MAEAKVAGPLKKKTAGLPLWGWVASVGGAGVVYYLYKKHAANTAAAATTADTSAGIIPAASALTGNTSISTAPPSLSSFESQFLAQAQSPNGGNLTASQAAQALNDFLSGNALSGTTAKITENIVSNLAAAGLVPAGVSTVIHVTNPAAKVTTTHTPSEAPNKAAAPVIRAEPLPSPVQAQRNTINQVTAERKANPTKGTPARILRPNARKVGSINPLNGTRLEAATPGYPYKGTTEQQLHWLDTYGGA